MTIEKESEKYKYEKCYVYNFIETETLDICFQMCFCLFSLHLRKIVE